MQTQGKSEVIEAVLVAVLASIATGLVNLGFEAYQERKKKKGRRERRWLTRLV